MASPLELLSSEFLQVSNVSLGLILTINPVRSFGYCGTKDEDLGENTFVPWHWSLGVSFVPAFPAFSLRSNFM